MPIEPIRLSIATEGDRTVSFATDVIKIGSLKSSQIVLAHPGVARMHAVIEWDGAYRLIDLGSESGTMVNGEPVRRNVPLGVGDVIGVGPCRIRVLAIGDQDAQPEETQDVKKSELETLRDAIVDIGQAVGLPGERVDMVVHEVRSLAKFAADVARATGLDGADVGVLANEVAVNAIALARVRAQVGVTSTRTDDLVAAIDRLQAPSVELCDLRDAMARIRNAVGLGPNAGRAVTADEVESLARFHHTACVCLGLDAGKPPSETMDALADALDAYVCAELDPPGVPEHPSPFVLVGTPSSGLESVDVRTVTRAWSQRGSHGVWLGTAVPQSVPAAYIELPCGTLVLCCDTDEEAAAIVERIHAARVACCR